jgi:hypothetical protein
MKLKRILLGLIAACISGLALAQTTLYPTIRGTYSEHQADIGYFGMMRIARTDTLTATASGTLANSAVLGTGMNVVATVTTTNDSFTLPTLTGSVQVIVVNGGANTLKVWPNVSTGQIDTAGAGTGKTVAANKMAIFTQGADGLWYSVTSP